MGFFSGPVSPCWPPPVSPVTPEGYDPAGWGFEEAAVAYVPRISLPDSEHILIERLGLADTDYEAYGALMDELRKAHGLAGVTQLLGYPAEIQHDRVLGTQPSFHGRIGFPTLLRNHEQRPATSPTALETIWSLSAVYKKTPFLLPNQRP